MKKILIYLFSILLLFSYTNALNYKFNHFSFWNMEGVVKSNGSYFALATKGNYATPLLCKLNINGTLDTIVNSNEILDFKVENAKNFIEWNDGFVFTNYSSSSVEGKKYNKGLYYYKDGKLVDLGPNIASVDSIITFSKMCVDSNNNLVVISKTQKILKKGSIGGVPTTHVDAFYKIHKLTPSFQSSIILEGELTTYSKILGQFIDLVCDKYGNIWTGIRQSNVGKSLIKIDKTNNKSFFSILTENNLFDLTPNYFQAIGDNLYIAITPTSSKNYFASYSVFDIVNEKWSFKNEIFKSNSENMDLIDNRSIVNKFYKQGENEIFSTEGNGIYFKILGDKEYRYLNFDNLGLDKSNKEFTSYLVNSVKYVDILDDRLIVITQPGIFEFTFADLLASSIDNNSENLNYDYKLLQNKVHFEHKTTASGYLISDEVGRQIKQGNFINEITIDDLAQGVYFILLDNKQLIKIIK